MSVNEPAATDAADVMVTPEKAGLVRFSQAWAGGTRAIAASTRTGPSSAPLLTKPGRELLIQKLAQRFELL
jgi:hypothetical protein